MSQEAALALQEQHTRHFADASIVLGRALKDLDTNGERKSRKQWLLDRRLAGLRETFPEAATVTDIYAVKAPAGFATQHGAALIVDLAFSMPFAPYELQYRDKALQSTGAEMKFGKAYMDRVLTLRGEALSAHSYGFLPSARSLVSSPWSLAVTTGVLALAALPFLPALLGGAALSGAAATAQGLAVLGGASLAMGGSAWRVARGCLPG